MALSEFDKQFLSLDDQNKILGLKGQWSLNNDATLNQSLNEAANAIRARYGYSGGGDGSQFISSGFMSPQAPNIQQYQSPYIEEVKGLMEDMRNTPAYQSPYEDLINKSISNLVSRPKFSYDPDSDEAYQAFLQRATRAGDKAYADNLGGLSAMTGGRPNSWAGTVASQARNEYIMQAQEAVIQFEDRAYSRYRDETSDMYNLLNALTSQDERAYGRYRDQIGDTKDLANMVMTLDDREFEQYRYMADTQWKVFDSEYRAYTDALQFKKDKIAEAIDRTNLQGFVNNTDAITLGIPAGTLSQSARERAEAMQDYITKQELDLKQFRKEKEISHEFDIKLMRARPASSSGSGGSSRSSSGSLIPSSSEASTANKEYDKFSKYVDSRDYDKLTEGAKLKYIQNYQAQIIGNAERNLYGKNSIEVADIILDMMYSHPKVVKLMNDYTKAYNKVQDLHYSDNTSTKQPYKHVGGGRYTE